MLFVTHRMTKCAWKFFTHSFCLQDNRMESPAHTWKAGLMDQQRQKKNSAFTSTTGKGAGELVKLVNIYGIHTNSMDSTILVLPST